ncbi:MAG: TlpA disulfide reductase family protein [Gammaproteobacteria bacterium]|nr:TlpA disulfide reductase family protein [Gammaproteobacteria bacterium]
MSVKLTFAGQVILAWILTACSFAAWSSDADISEINSNEASKSVATDDASATLGTEATDSLDESRQNSKISKNCKKITPLEKSKRPWGLIRAITRDQKLRPRDKVPEFTLPRLDGENVSLYEVLSKNEFVLVDFWATACAPCIAQFPALKELYSAYSDDGFEIVSVSVDLTYDQWEESSKRHNLPWIDVGEINDQGLVGPTSMAYHLRGLPRSYLVDTNGCIFHTHNFPIELGQFLEARYGKQVESLEKTLNPADSELIVERES